MFSLCKVLEHDEADHVDAIVHNVDPVLPNLVLDFIS